MTSLLRKHRRAADTMRLAVLIGGVALVVLVSSCGGSSSRGAATATALPPDVLVKTYLPTLGSIPTSIPTKPPGVTMMDRLSEAMGWVMKDKRLLITHDAGSTWLDVSPPRMARFSHVFFLDERHGWVADADDPANGKAGPVTATVFRTNDGGMTWGKSSFTAGQLPDGRPPTLSLESVQFVDARNGWVTLSIGGAAVRCAILFRTTNGGANWTELPASGARFCSIGSGTTFVSSMTGWLSSISGAVLLTHDGGSSWEADAPAVENASTAPADGACRGNLENIDAVGVSGDDVVAFVGRLACGNGTDAILLTTDGGSSWRALSAPADLIKLQMITKRTWIAGSYDELFRTDDGGETWVALTPSWRSAIGDASDMKSPGFDFVTGDSGWLLAETATHSHVLVATSDGGHTWHALHP